MDLPRTNVPSSYVLFKKGSAESGERKSQGTVVIVRKESDNTLYVEKQFTGDAIRRVYHAEKALLSSLWATGMRSPAIQNMHDCFLEEQRSRASIFLRYCDQGSLLDLIGRHKAANLPISEGLLWKVFRSMTQAIAYLHALDKPTVHRNLRARNVLFITSPNDPNFPDVRVAGFEFAIQGDDLSFDAGITAKAREVVIEGGYQPPEHPHYYTASDVWQIATCVNRANNGTVGMQKESQELRDAIECCLARDPARRPAAIQLEEMMAHAWKFQIDWRRFPGTMLWPNKR